MVAGQNLAQIHGLCTETPPKGLFFVIHQTVLIRDKDPVPPALESSGQGRATAPTRAPIPPPRLPWVADAPI